MKETAFRVRLVPLLLLIAAGTAAMAQPSSDAAKPVPAPAASPPTIILTGPAAQSAPAWATAAISAIAGLIGAFVGGYFATRNAKAAIIQKTNELEIAAIDKRVGDFIAPYEQLSLENLKLSRELKRGRDAKFRTLIALLDPNWKNALSQGDRAIVEAIVQNGKDLRQMILEHGGAVSTTIRPHLAAASMHFRMLALADAGSLDSDPVRYEDYVYPQQLDNVLTLERQRLETRRELLRSRPDEAHGTIADLQIPATLSIA